MSRDEINVLVASRALGIHTPTVAALEAKRLREKMNAAWPHRERAAHKPTMPAVGLRPSPVLTAMKRSGIV